ISTQTTLISYSVVVTPTLMNCPVTTVLSVRINNPPTPTLTMPPPLCNTSTQTFVTGSPGGGTWYNNPFVNSLGVVTPYQATTFGLISTCYSISIGACSATNCANISISRFNTANLTSTLASQCVSGPP